MKKKRLAVEEAQTAPPKIRRYELERFVQAALLNVLRGGRSEHARVSAARELIMAIQYQREKNAQMKRDRRHGDEACEDNKRQEENYAAAIVEAKKIMDEFKKIRRSVGSKGLRAVGANGAR